MPSAFIVKRETKLDGRNRGKKRHIVRYRLGGREAAILHGGSFLTEREARMRRDWIAGELAAGRVPDLRMLDAFTAAPTFREAADSWRASRIDVAEGTRTLHRVALNRAMPLLGDLRVDELGIADLNRLIEELAAAKRKETIRKTIKYALAVLGREGVTFTDEQKKEIRLPHEEQEELTPPAATHVEAVYRLLPSAYRLPLLWLDWSGARVASIDNLLVGDDDEQQRRVRLRASTTKTRAALWVELHPTLADRIEANLPPREDRDLEAHLFPGCSADRLRMAIARACKAAGVPVFSPHDLRHRRISLLHAQGRSWAEIGRFVGQRKVSITADTYTHVLSDGAELDYRSL